MVSDSTIVYSFLIFPCSYFRIILFTIKLDEQKKQINNTPRISVISTTKSSTSALEVNTSVQTDIPTRIIPNIINNTVLLILIGNYKNIKY